MYCAVRVLPRAGTHACSRTQRQAARRCEESLSVQPQQQWQAWRHPQPTGTHACSGTQQATTAGSARQYGLTCVMRELPRVVDKLFAYVCIIHAVRLAGSSTGRRGPGTGSTAAGKGLYRAASHSTHGHNQPSPAAYGLHNQVTALHTRPTYKQAQLYAAINLAHPQLRGLPPRLLGMWLWEGTTWLLTSKHNRGVSPPHS